MRFRIICTLVFISGAAYATPAAATELPKRPTVPSPLLVPNQCGSYPGGTGLLSDGDFHDHTNPGSYGPTYAKGTVFAPGWIVRRRTIDLYGIYFDAPYSLCSIDLDGSPGAGGIEHSPFPTTVNTTYTVTFLFSGNGACGEPVVKTMTVKAQGQSERLTWNVSNGNDAQHGVWALQTWQFVAHTRTATLKFRSDDYKGYACGPAVAAISVVASGAVRTAASRRPWGVTANLGP